MAIAYRTLIDTATLAAHRSDTDLCIVDCRFELGNPDWGQREYAAAHIPGAVYAHLDRDLSGAKTGSNGRHPLPDAAALTQTFERLGIGPGVQVVAYDQDTGMYASRLWWLLRWLGHDAAAVLDGGFAAWTREERPTTSGTEDRAPRTFEARPRTGMLVTADDVMQVLNNPAWRLLDARAPERFRGEVEPIDKVAGHIPGATNHFYQTNLTEAGTFKPAEDLRAAYSGETSGVPTDHVICYCGSGVTACHDVLALEHAGLRGAKLYAGSWSEWSAGDRPMDTGAGKAGGAGGDEGQVG